MAQKLNETVQNRVIRYRCFNKEFQEFDAPINITEQKHLERAEHDEVVIVDDRNCDWLELANQDVGKVGLANLLKLAEKGQMDITQCRFAPETEGGLDISGLDPMDPNAVKSTVASAKTNADKLESIAKQLGVGSDDLVKALLDGSLGTLIETKVKQETVSEGGQENA